MVHKNLNKDAKGGKMAKNWTTGYEKEKVNR